MKETGQTAVCHVKHDFFDVYIGRKADTYPASMWGNPFVVDEQYSREEAIACYTDYLFSQARLLCALPTLRGLRLGCWCHPQACHGDVLAELVNSPNMWQVIANRITPEVAKEMLCLYKDWYLRTWNRHRFKASEISDEKQRFVVAYNVRIDNEWEQFRMDHPEWGRAEQQAWLGARL